MTWIMWQRAPVRRAAGASTGAVGAGEWRGREVAIKTVLFQSGAGDNQTALVASEAAIASNLIHRNIVSTFSYDIRNVAENSGNELAVFKFYLVQEYCNGGTLRQALHSRYFTAQKTPQRWEAAAGILRGVAAGMDYMHGKRICHGDLNPSNVLLKVRRRVRHAVRRRGMRWLRVLAFVLPAALPHAGTCCDGSAVERVVGS